MPLHSFFALAVAFGLGWIAHALRERRKTPRKRSRAIPKGTDATKRPGRPRKAAPAPATPIPGLDGTLEG